MRIRATVVTLLLCLPLAAAPAALADPAAPPPAPPTLNLPGLPPIPLPVLPAPAPAAGIPVPPLHELVDALVPAPPVPVLPVPAAGVEVPELAPDLAAFRQAVLPAATGDPLFDRWPLDLADRLPGEVLEIRDITASAAPLLLVPIRQATLLKFRTTDAHGAPSFATATLVVPAAPWTGAGPRPVLVNNLPIDALGKRCTPGYTMAHGLSFDTNVTDFVPPTTALAAARGYAVLIPDHEGPWMAYAEPVVAGHAVLDAVRAARGWNHEEFAGSRFAMTGYSGGAIATHGAVKMLPGYAPELADSVVGAALGGVPADFEILARSMNANLASGVFMAAILAIGRERPEILDRINHLGRWVALSPIKDECIGVFALPGLLQLPIDVAADMANPLGSELATEIYEVTRMPGIRTPVPLYIYNGDQEFWIPAEGARNLYREQCALGANAVYRGVLGEHIIGAATGYPEAVRWLDQRLRGAPAISEC
ncbi:lipase family protein [Nocardia sp. NPDC050697]|uniref:lipase family protein n=1 Tax=Nocardia sp. NPDC050697 TaxID=3155158 RepID=UPI0033EBF310